MIEEKVVGPSSEELAATRDAGKAAMQDRNEQARKAREAAKAIKKERAMADSAHKVLLKKKKNLSGGGLLLLFGAQQKANHQSHDK